VTSFNEGSLVVRTIADGTAKVVQSGGYYGRYVPSGHLLYARDGTLFGMPFDVTRLETTGVPVPIVNALASIPQAGAADFAVSHTGTLAYAPGENLSNGRSLAWLERGGSMTPARETPSDWSDLRVSPDGKRFALTLRNGPNADIWVDEWATDAMSRLTFEPVSNSAPIWSPDGRHIAFASKRADKQTYNIYLQRADGGGEAQRLTDSKSHQIPASWHPSGAFIAFAEQHPGMDFDLMVAPMVRDSGGTWKAGTPRAWLQSPALEQDPQFSPDGKWIAYFSDETGKPEVFVRPFPGPGGKWQVSNGGGNYAAWSRTRPELYYSSLDQHIIAVPYRVDGESFSAGKPELWAPTTFAPGPYRRMDLHPDGKRFVIGKLPENADAKNRLVLVFNFFEELRRLAPATK
jgi:serine/threonine-protein kinase